MSTRLSHKKLYIISDRTNYFAVWKFDSTICFVVYIWLDLTGSASVFASILAIFDDSCRISFSCGGDFSGSRK